jgi:hypothetical protein
MVACAPAKDSRSQFAEDEHHQFLLPGTYLPSNGGYQHTIYPQYTDGGMTGIAVYMSDGNSGTLTCDPDSGLCGSGTWQFQIINATTYVFDGAFIYSWSHD